MIAAFAENVSAEMGAKQRLLTYVNGEIGYSEGNSNYNKYADIASPLVGWNVQNQPWCAVFVVASFSQCFGAAGTRLLLRANNLLSARCKDNYERFRSCGKLFPTPEVGDVVYYYVNGDVNHEGIVVDVSNSLFSAVEGNSSDRVQINTYPINYSSVAGFGRPAWECMDEPDEPQEPKQRTYRRLAYGDGLNNPLSIVAAWQDHLANWGYALDSDGEFGRITESCTLQWQQYMNDTYGTVEVNGIVDEDDWKEIILLEGAT